MSRPERTDRRPSAALLAVAVVVATAVAGCGVRLDDRPRRLDAGEVPYGLLEPSTTLPGESPTSAVTLPAFQATSVYLVDNNDFLVEVRRQLPGAVRVAVGSLLTPPTEAEVNSGLRTAIDSDIALRGVSGPEDGLVTIDLTSADEAASSLDIPRLALAQLVYTATAVPGVSRVLFQVDGQAREVPTGEGQSTAEPLSRVDYRQFVRPPASTTTVVADPVPGAGG